MADRIESYVEIGLANKENIEYTRDELKKKTCGQLKDILRVVRKTVGGNKEL